MRLGIRVKEAAAVTLLALFIVATTTLIHLSQLSRVVVRETARQAELISRQIYAQTGQVIARMPQSNPVEALRLDRELRSLLDASVGYSPNLVYALIADRMGRPILHTQNTKEGVTTSSQPALQTLVDLDPLRRFLALYRAGRVDHARQARADGWRQAEPGRRRHRPAAGVARRSRAGASDPATDPRAHR